MSFLERLFKREPVSKSEARVIRIENMQISTWTGTAYENDIYRAAVDAIARNAAKLKGVHAVIYGGNQKTTNDMRLNRLLQISPNKYMSAYDMLYKLVTQYFVNNNAYAVLDWGERGQLKGIYPVNYTHVDFETDKSGNIYCEFTFRNGQKGQFDYEDVIHLRRHFNNNELLGDNNGALDAALELAHTQSQGLVSGIKSSANIRGILKFTQIMSKAKLKESKENFISDYLNISNAGGVVAVDNQMEYVPIEQKPVILDAGQTKAISEKIYNYLGVSEKIVNSSYNEDEYAAFYESVIEPIATQMSLEFTRKIFNEREQAYGNQIIFESGRLQFSSNETKVNLIKELMPLGLLTINQALEILNIAPVENGDRRLQTLNVVDAEKVTEYQMMKAGWKNGNEDNESNDGQEK